MATRVRDAADGKTKRYSNYIMSDSENIKKENKSGGMVLRTEGLVKQ